jgi:hypothetical protein
VYRKGISQRHTTGSQPNSVKAIRRQADFFNNSTPRRENRRET